MNDLGTHIRSHHLRAGQGCGERRGGCEYYPERGLSLCFDVLENEDSFILKSVEQAFECKCFLFLNFRAERGLNILCFTHE